MYSALMAHRPHIPDPVYEAAEQVMEKHEYSNIGEAIRHVFREADYNV